MSLDIDRCATEKEIERNECVEKSPVASVPHQEHTDGADTDVRTGKSSCRTLTRRLGIFHKSVKESIGITGTGQTILMKVEIIVHVREYSRRDIFHAHCLIIESGTGNGNENKDDVIDKESRQDDKRRTLKLIVSPNEIIENGERNHRVISGVAHIEQFAEKRIGQFLGKEQRGLHTEPILFPSGKHMVEIGEETIEFVGIGLPPCQECELRGYAYQARETARENAIDKPQRGCHCHHAQPTEHHRLRLAHFRIKEKGQDKSEQQIGHHCPFHRQQSLQRFLLYLKQILYKFLHRLVYLKLRIFDKGGISRQTLRPHIATERICNIGLFLYPFIFFVPAHCLFHAARQIVFRLIA